MAVDRTFKDQADLQGLQGDAIIDLMIIDLAPVSDEITPENRYLRFVNWVVTDGQRVSYGGLTYEPVPLKATGFAIQTEGVPPNPVLTVSNIGLDFTALVNRWDDMVGAKLTRRRVLARHLDSGSAPDANAHWPDEVWTIQQKEAENKLAVSFRLSTAFDLDGITLPKRRALRYTCPWTYREEGCDYAGPPVADARDAQLSPTGPDPLTNEVIIRRNNLFQTRIELETASNNYTIVNDNLNNVIASSNYWAGLLANGPTDTLAEERYNVGGVVTYIRDAVVERVAPPPNPGSPNATTKIAYWDGAVVTLGQEYRQGEYRDRLQAFDRTYYYNNLYAIQRWVSNSAEYAQWQANYNNAQYYVSVYSAELQVQQTILNAKRAAFDSATTLYRNAAAAWQASPPSDAVLRATGDACGKRLTSCRLRFYDPATDAYDSLPFGGFPGLTI